MRNVEFYAPQDKEPMRTVRVELRGHQPQVYVAVMWADGAEAIFPSEWLRVEAEKHPVGKR